FVTLFVRVAELLRDGLVLPIHVGELHDVVELDVRPVRGLGVLAVDPDREQFVDAVVAADVDEVTVDADDDAVGFREILEDKRDDVADPFEEATPRALYAEYFVVVLEHENLPVLALGRSKIWRVLAVH